MKNSKIFLHVIARATCTVCVMLFISFSLNADARNYTVYQNPNSSETKPTSEAEAVDYAREIYDEFGVDKIKEAVPQEVTEYMETDLLNNENFTDYSAISEKLSFGFILDVIMKILGKTLPSVVKGFLPILAVIILSAFAGVFKNSLSSESISSVVEFVVILCFAGVVFITVRNCFEIAKEYLNTLHIFISSVMPIMSSLTAVSGNVAAAAANASGMVILLTLIDIINNSVLIHILQICFALSLATNLSPSVNLSGISEYIRSTFTWIFVFIMTTLVTVLVYQNILASSADTMAARTIKFTVSSFIPVIGGLVGEASRTIIGSIQAVKSTAGVFGVLVIIITLLPPLITVALNKFVLKIFGAIALILGTDKEAAILKDMNSLLDITLAIMISLSVVVVFMITIFIKTTTV